MRPPPRRTPAHPRHDRRRVRHELRDPRLTHGRGAVPHHGALRVDRALARRVRHHRLQGVQHRGHRHPLADRTHRVRVCRPGAAARRRDGGARRAPERAGRDRRLDRAGGARRVRRPDGLRIAATALRPAAAVPSRPRDDPARDRRAPRSSRYDAAGLAGRLDLRSARAPRDDRGDLLHPPRGRLRHPVHDRSLHRCGQLPRAQRPVLRAVRPRRARRRTVPDPAGLRPAAGGRDLCGPGQPSARTVLDRRGALWGHLLAAASPARLSPARPDR